MKNIIVIGGGAAGISASLFAAKSGAKVILLEKNEKLGKKLYITGKGRCNITNAAEPEKFMKQILRNPRFMYAALAALDNTKLMDLIESLGVPLKIERGERVFPESDKSSDITRCLELELRRLGVDTRLNSKVDELIIEDSVVKGVKLTGGKEIFADSVIITTGGISYPLTGSTGDGHKFARETGHSVTDLLPALVPINTKEDWCKRLTGLTLKNVTLRAYAGKKRIYSEQGEMLLTHFGISGPLALTLSSLLPKDLSDVKITIDLKPAIDDATLDARLVREIAANSRKTISTVMDSLEPHSMGQEILALADVSPTLPANALTKEQRIAIRTLMKNMPVTPVSLRGFDEAIITRGGVAVKDINPSTMESKKVMGLYFAGEVIDIDATTGGFNLQIAFSTGALAGSCAAKTE